MVIIGFGHKARNGKDFCCQEIIKEFSSKYNIKKYAFADQLKEELFYKLFDNDDKLWKEIKHPGLPVQTEGFLVETPIEYMDKHKSLFRYAVQYYGESKRLDNPFYWINALHKKLLKDNPAIALISDLRYTNEFQYIKSLSGYTVKVNRVGFFDPNINNSHPSEIDLINAKFDFEISCLDGDLDSLRQDAIEVFNIIRDSLSNEFPTLEDLTVCSYQKKATS